MAENSKIEWCDHTFNPWMGCTKVSAACANCYAERDMDKRFGKVAWGPNGTRVKTSESNWKKPLAWNRKAEESGIRPRVFCASLADVFEDWDGLITCYQTGDPLVVNQNGHIWPSGWPSMSDGDDWGLREYTMGDMRQQLFALIDATPNLDWLLLTKRPENVRRMIKDVNPEHTRADITVPQQFRKNVWLGVSAENQEQADTRIPELLQCRNLASVLFLSCEPLLGGVDIEPWLPGGVPMEYDCDRNKEVIGSRENECEIEIWKEHVDWVIAGGESGPNARPSHPDWFRLLREQCSTAGIPFHFKQWGEWIPMDEYSPFKHGPNDDVYDHLFLYPNGSTNVTDANNQEALPVSVFRVGKLAAGRELDEVVHDGFPAVRQVS